MTRRSLNPKSPMSIDQQVKSFLSSQTFAVVGASSNRQKYGNKVFRIFLQQEYSAFPVNPNATEVEGHPTFADLSQLPKTPMSISIITQPSVTEQVVEQAISLGVQHVWMQPGAESAKAIQLCEDAGVNVIHGGPCILIELAS